MLKPLWKDFSYQTHQVEGVEWMIEKEAEFPHGGILCDEMGLGKTIQMLALMKINKVKATLMIVPLCTVDQWQGTAEKCGFSVWRCHDKEDTWVLPQNYSPTAVQLYLTNYERLVARPLLGHRRMWDRVVVDEAHRLGNTEGKTYKVIKKIHADRHWLLTATPIVNGLHNASALFALIGCKVTPTLESMKPLIQENVLCRRMEDLRDSIPSLPNEAQEIHHALDFDSPEEEDFYRGIQGIIQRQWRVLEHEEGGAQAIFRLIMNLRQLSVHPQVYIAARRRQFRAYSRPDWTGSSTKFRKLSDLILEDSEKPHRWIVFCHFHHEMEMLQQYLSEKPTIRDVHIYNGKLNMSEKREVLEASKTPLQGCQQEVLLVQLQSGGTGLNLQHCDRIVFMGPWWTAALMDQAIGRAVRIGQTEQVIVHHLVLKEEESMNIDKKMLAAADTKRVLCEKFLEIAMEHQKNKVALTVL